MNAIPLLKNYYAKKVSKNNSFFVIDTPGVVDSNREDKVNCEKIFDFTEKNKK